MYLLNLQACFSLIKPIFQEKVPQISLSSLLLTSSPYLPLSPPSTTLPKYASFHPEEIIIFWFWFIGGEEDRTRAIQCGVSSKEPCGRADCSPEENPGTVCTCSCLCQLVVIYYT